MFYIKTSIYEFFVQLLSCIQLFAIPWTAACQASLSLTISWSLLELMSVESVMLSNHLILCRPLLLLPSILPGITVFSNESALPIRWPKCWSFSISPANEYSGLISFRIDWLDLLVIQGTLKSLLQHHSSKASTLWRSAFFMVRLWHLNNGFKFTPHPLPCLTFCILREGSFIPHSLSALRVILQKGSH